MINLSNNKEYQNGTNIIKKLQEEGFQAFFVGGAVRDMVLGKTPKDFDIVTSALPNEVIKLFPHNYPVGKSFGVVCVVEKKQVFEVATMREEREYADGRHPEIISYTNNPEIDAKRRDFTMNGLFYNPINNIILDYVDGQKDIDAGIIRTIGIPIERFNEDYLRILRAIRFSVQLNFTLEENTLSAIFATKDFLKILSKERVRDELNKILLSSQPAKAFELMYKLQILDIIFPELNALVGVKQPKKYHPEGDVFVHTMLMLKFMQYPSIELAWSVLLHDIGKPKTFSIDENNVEHFYGHEAKGAKLAEKILKNFKFSNAMIKTVKQAVRNHMKFASIDKMREFKRKRIIASADFSLELELHRLDCFSSNKKMGNFLLLLDKIEEMKNEVKLPEPLLTGKDLISLGIKPSPIFKKILEEIQILQLENKLQSTERAKKYVQENFISF